MADSYPKYDLFAATTAMGGAQFKAQGFTWYMSGESIGAHTPTRPIGPGSLDC